MSVDALQLARDMVAIPSVSHDSNAEVSDLAQRVLEREGFEVERLTYPDKDGRDALKVSLVAKKGSGIGGIGFFSHTDTVPGDVGWNAFDPALRDGKLYGRGSCDMKGPAAATIEAACSVDARALKHPVYIALTADEESGYHGALHITHESALLKQNWPAFGVVAEPTELRPVYSHKGGTTITVTAKGVAAHTSTERGTSANFLIAPFLAEMAALVPVFKSDPRLSKQTAESSGTGARQHRPSPHRGRVDRRKATNRRGGRVPKID
jgi:acetylornithine deacetylase